MQVRKQQLELDMDQQTGSKLGEGYVKAYIVTCLFNLHAEYIMQNPGWMNKKLDSRLPGEISITSDMQMTPPLWQKVKKK